MRSLVVLVALVAGCTVSRRSTEFTCTTQADCPSDRTCSSGFCVLGGAADASIDGTMTPGCPAACTSCDLAAHSCAITGDSTVTCPPGWACNVTCTRAGSCDRVDCGTATSCTVTCSGTGSCSDVRCGDGKCSVMCSGTGACDAVDCHSACACDVTCHGNSCNDQAPTCPASACTTNNGCSSTPAGCNAC